MTLLSHQRQPGAAGPGLGAPTGPGGARAGRVLRLSLKITVTVGGLEEPGPAERRAAGSGRPGPGASRGAGPGPGPRATGHGVIIVL